jgi:hypothetical protein
MDRQDMTMEQEIEFVNQCFDNYEKEGFSKVFVSPYDYTDEISNRQGASFKVIGRTKMRTETDNGEATADLECLPMWQIQFEDGKVISAYAEEIIPSEIKENLWRESDKQYLEQI